MRLAIMLPFDKKFMTSSKNRLSGLGEDTTQRHLRALGTSVLVPSRCTLDDLTAEMSRAGGVGLAELECVTSLQVQTRNTVYEITVPRPPEATVFVQGGQVFPTVTEAIFSGSSLGGSCLKLAWFGVGLHMEFRCADGVIVTSRVRSIRVRDTTSVHGPF